MTLLPFLTFFAFAVSAQDAPSLQSKVTLQLRADGLANIIKKISEQTRVPIECDLPLNRRIIVIDVQDVVLQDLLDKISEVSDTEWTTNKGVQHLGFSQAKDQAAEQQYNSKIAQEIKNSIESYRKIADRGMDSKQMANYLRDQLVMIRRQRESGAWRTDYAKYNDPEQAAMSMAPSNRLIARALQKVDINLLSKIKDDQRLVYTTNPTRLQQKLNIDLKAEREQFINEAKVMKEAVKIANLSVEEKRQLGLGYDPGEDIHRGSVEGAAPDATSAEEDVTLENQIPTRAKLTLSRMDSYGTSTIYASLEILGKDGVPLESSNANLYTDLSMYRLYDDLGAESELTPQASGGSPDSDWLQKLLMSGSNSEEAKKLRDDPRYNSIFLKPNTHEPLSFMTSDVLFKSKEVLKKNLVAEISDDSILISFLRSSNVGDKKLIDSLGRSFFEINSDLPEWSLWKLSNRARKRSEQVDRLALSQFMAGIATPSKTSLEEAAMYSWIRKSTSDMNMVEAAYMDTSLKNRSAFELTHPAILLLGSLDQNTRNMLMAGQALSYSNLMPASKRLLEQWAYGMKGYGSHNSDGPIWDPKYNPQKEYEGEDNEEYYQDFEPTEELANGIPLGATLKLRQTRRDLLFAWTKDYRGNETWLPIDTSSIAWAIAVQKKPSLNPEKEPIPEYKKFRLGQSVSIGLVFWVGPKSYFSYINEEPNPKPSSNDLTFEQLPPNTIKEVNEIVKDYLEGGD